MGFVIVRPSKITVTRKENHAADGRRVRRRQRPRAKHRVLLPCPAVYHTPAFQPQLNVMHPYKKEFLQFAIQVGVLRFGEFTLKSGRISPYFFNAGLFNSGRTLAQLGRFYARAIVDAGVPFDLLYGPAYKGIPLAALSAAALAEHQDMDVPYSYNRKEAKAHGECGSVVGAPLSGRVLIVDDVITAGGGYMGRAFHLPVSSEVRVVAPDENIQRMGAPACDESDGVIVVVPPGVTAARLAAIGPPGGGAEPHVVIETRRHGLRRLRRVRRRARK